MPDQTPSVNDLVLAPEWVDWLVENFVEGVPSAELATSLDSAGVPTALSASAICEIEQNTLLRSFRKKVAARDQLEQLVVLKRELARRAPLLSVERRADLGADEFFELYYAANRPVILTDVADKWPAIDLWSRPEYFAEKFGDTPLSVCMGRDSNKYCDRNYSSHFKTMTMRDYAAWVANAGESNDGYLVSNNRLLENEKFLALLDDIVPPEKYIDPSQFRNHMSFWFGPAGTRTPLHHDGNNILFCQVAGRKEFYLVNPFEAALIRRAEGYYAHTQIPSEMKDEGLRKADDSFPWRALRVVLQPGEAIFLPIGWWHQVRALDLSVSISFLNFKEENRFSWYAPGKLNQL